MRKSLKYFRRYFLWQTVAAWVFLGTVILLYITNMTMRIFAYQDSAWEFLRDLVFPLLIAACVGALIVEHKFYRRLFGLILPKYPILAVCIPVIAALLSIFACDDPVFRIDFNIVLLAAAAMCTALYALRRTQLACFVTVLLAIGFMFLAAHLEYNTAAIVTIGITALVLLIYLPIPHGLRRDREDIWVISMISIITLPAGLLLCTVLEGCLTQRTPQIWKAFEIASYGRPSLGSSSWVNEQCAQLLSTARFVGSVPIEYPLDNLFSNRVPSYILSQGGWLAVAPILLSLVLMIISGFYLCYRSFEQHCYISTASMAIITVQAIGYVMMCIGWDGLLFSQLCPFLDGDWRVNTVFLLMALCILPPKPRRRTVHADEVPL